MTEKHKTDKEIIEMDRLVGERIKFRRKGMKMTQKGLGEKIGVSFQQVQKYEKGTNRIGAGALYKIARVLKMGVHQIYDEIPSHDAFAPREAQQLRETESELVFSSLRSKYMGEAIELLASFDKVPNAKTRQQIIDLAETLAAPYIKIKNN